MSYGTFSKHPSRYPADYPKYIDCGLREMVMSGGREYVDWCQGLAGGGLLGHGGIVVSTAIGNAFHLPTRYEYEVADLLCAVLPDYAEDVRFGLNGTDVTSAAVRLARAVTGRNKIVVFDGQYHGASTSDWFISGLPGARGIDRGTTPPIKAVWNDVESLKAALSNEVAAVIFEIPAVDPTTSFVDALNAVWESGSLLIADEVVTGFRLAIDGACGEYGIRPDLACFGKAMGSGVPISALVGKKFLMREFDLAHTLSPVFFSLTHAAHPLGLCAIKETISELERTNAFFVVREIGTELMEAFVKVFPDGHAIGQPARSNLKFEDPSKYSLFQNECAKMGHLFGVTNCPTIHHDNVVDATWGLFRRVKEAMDDVKEWTAPPPLYQVRTP